MARQEQLEKPRSARREDAPLANAQPNPAVIERGQELKEQIDQLMDEIDGLLDEVRQSGFTIEEYVQKGGE
jgi:uncharacterized coiled-coil DUF342 family protein